MDVSWDASWMDKLKTVTKRNRPSQKPQLWENFPLALRRRLAFELGHRLNSSWLDRPRVVDLSQVGFDDGLPPLRMEIVSREVMNKALFLYGTFEISETRLVQAILRPGMTLIDVGANIGYYTLVGARIVGRTGSVHSFEPNPAVRDRLSVNVQLNGFQNVVIHDEAMTQRTGSIRFYVSAVSENSGISSIVPGNGLGAEGREVPCVSLDDFVGTLSARHVDLIKMDIEGAELDVIEGGRHLLGRADAPALLFESFKVEPLLAALRSLGYQIRRLHYRLSNGLELPKPEDATESLFSAYESPNYFAVKDPSMFDRVLQGVNTRRSAALRFLGRI